MVSKNIIKIDTNIQTLNISKLDDAANQKTPVTFRIKVKFDEKGRKVDETIVEFGITINLEPNIGQIGIEGNAVVNGKPEVMNESFSTPPNSQVPNILFEIYEKIFTAIYVATSILEMPCPSPELLKSSSQGKELEDK
ncbi:hypothetical protein ACFL96_15885 [Thermoproteota archaeon]